MLFIHINISSLLTLNREHVIVKIFSFGYEKWGKTPRCTARSAQTAGSAPSASRCSAGFRRVVSVAAICRWSYRWRGYRIRSFRSLLWETPWATFLWFRRCAGDLVELGWRLELDRQRLFLRVNVIAVKWVLASLIFLRQMPWGVVAGLGTCFNDRQFRFLRDKKSAQ